VASAGVIAFLGAKNRKASQSATFMIHRTYASPQIATSDRLHSIAQALILDDERTEDILKNLKLSQAHWATHKHSDVWLSAQEALDSELITEIAEFAPPKGATIFYVGPTV
jgi:ATP-dependent Clp protease protease subunit